MSSVIPEDELVPQDPDLCLRKLTSLNVNKEKGLGSDFLQELARVGGLLRRDSTIAGLHGALQRALKKGHAFAETGR